MDLYFFSFFKFQIARRNQEFAVAIGCVFSFSVLWSFSRGLLCFQTCSSFTKVLFPLAHDPFFSPTYCTRLHYCPMFIKNLIFALYNYLSSPTSTCPISKYFSLQLQFCTLVSLLDNYFSLFHPLHQALSLFFMFSSSITVFFSVLQIHLSWRFLLVPIWTSLIIDSGFGRVTLEFSAKSFTLLSFSSNIFSIRF